MPESFTATYLPGILMMLVFLGMMMAMYARRISALLALPIMAFLFAVIGVIEYSDMIYLLHKHMGSGNLRLFLWTAEAVLIVWTILSWLSHHKHMKTQAAAAGAIITFLIFLVVNTRGLMNLMSLDTLSAILGKLHIGTIVNGIISEGALKLYKAYTVAFFGGMLAILVKEKKIAETFIKYAAELGGDNPIFVAILMMLVCFMLFTTLGGLGAIIMVGTIILPIMMSLGIHPLVAGGVFLLGLCAGGSFNPAGWALYEETLKVPRSQIQLAALVMIVLYLATGVIFIVLNLMQRRRRRYFSTPETPKDNTKVHPIALLSPVIPILLVFRLGTFVNLLDWVKGRADWLDSLIEILSRLAAFWDTNIGAWDFIPAFIAGILFCLITTWDRRLNNIRIMTKAMIEGAESVMPAVILMMGIGMLLNAVWHPDVSRYLHPLIKNAIPSTRLWYVVVFGLCAPLALYRGPLNLWGLGLGIAALIYDQSILSAAAIMGIFITTGAIQGVCDPTNTHNVWIATYISEDVIKLTKKLLIYVWIMVFIGLLIMSFLFPLHKKAEEKTRAGQKQQSLAVPDHNIRILS